MVFTLDRFIYLYFWSAANNALIFGELLRLFNGMNRPLRVTQSHWVVKCIRLLPRPGRWTEVSYGLRQLVTGQQGYAPFTYGGLVEFLLVAEEVLDDLGEGSEARQETAHQLTYDVLVEPPEHLNLPSTLVGRNVFEDQQITAMELERPVVRQCRRVATLWFRWVNA